MQLLGHPTSLTRRVFLLSLAIALLFVAFPAGVRGQGDADDLARNRQRWERMSEEERATMRRRFEELRRMGPEERRELHNRARNLRHLENGLRKAPPEELERRMRRHHHERDREKEVQLYIRENSEKFGRHMKDKLPPELREKFEQASPEERKQLLAEHFRGCRSRGGSWMEGAIRSSDLSDAEKERVLALPEEEQRKKVFELKRQWMRARVQERGVPSGITAEQWEQIELLSDEEFFSRLRALDPMPEHMRGRRFWDRSRGGRRGDGPGRGTGPGRRGDADRGEGPGWRGERGGGRDGETERGDRRRGPDGPPRKGPPPTGGGSGGRFRDAI